jgi:leucyl/phenylalanyl-tRNA--protein transferase
MNKTLFTLTTDDFTFPNPEYALDDPDGLLAIGGDLSVQRLINAYHHAIFPWFSQGEPILWWSPSERAVIHPEHVHISKSMAKFMRTTTLKVTLNYAFSEVIKACAQPRKTQSGTWISPAIQQAYQQLHQKGLAHSIEVWDSDLLVGGLYGINVGGVFCGESMFHTQTNASKLAFITLCQHFSHYQGKLIDCQMITPHLESLGVIAITRSDFIKQLQKYKNIIINNSCWDRKNITLL